jgi:hypothetical protein
MRFRGLQKGWSARNALPLCFAFSASSLMIEHRGRLSKVPMPVTLGSLDIVPPGHVSPVARRVSPNHLSPSWIEPICKPLASLAWA